MKVIKTKWSVGCTEKVEHTKNFYLTSLYHNTTKISKKFPKYIFTNDILFVILSADLQSVKRD